MSKKTTLLSLVQPLIQKAKRDNIAEYAYCLTYHLLLSFFPFLMFLATLAGNAGIALDSAIPKAFLPEEIRDLASLALLQMDRQPHKGYLLLTLIAASGGFRTILKGANRIGTSPVKRGLVFEHLLSLIFVVFFVIAIALALAGIVFGEQILDGLHKTLQLTKNDASFAFLRIALPFSFVFFLFLAIYIFIPSPKVCFRCAWPGAVFATIVWMVLTLAFQWYVNRFARHSILYGTLGSAFVLLLWLQLTSMILLLGMELNALLLEMDLTKENVV